tara:strand:+ start:1139 stop:2467 length:1329 start_codon:yes stop_codon:yes gene_type:complete
MQTGWNIIKELESDNSRLFKEKVIWREAMADNVEFFEGCKMALDKLYTFGVKQVPTATKDGPGCSWEQFNELTRKLNNRTSTGHAARDLIKFHMDISTIDQWNNWYRRILIKDLKCGVSEKTINSQTKKALKEKYNVPVFQCMLAHDSANHEKKMVGMKQVEVKLDGVRVILIARRDGTVETFSRNGKQFHNFQHICDEVRQTIMDHELELNYDLVLDGEVMSSSFQDLMKQVHRKSMTTASDAVLHLFDMMPLDKFLEGEYPVSQQIRSKNVQHFVDTYKPILKHVQALSFENIDFDSSEGQERFKQLNKEAVEGGYEGVMIKDPNAYYECKRSHSWLKAKPFIEVSLKVTGLEQGTGRNEGILGALIVEGTDDGKMIKTNVGSGLTDANRKEFWENQDKLIGQIVEIRADAITQNQDSTDYSLRFPRFLRFRGFEKGEKI